MPDTAAPPSPDPPAPNALALQELGASHRQVRFVFEQLPDAALFITPGRRIAWMNAAAEEMFGRTVAELHGQLSAVLFDDVPPARADALALDDLDEAPKAEVMCRRADGRPFPAECVQGTLTGEDDTRRGTFLIIRDMSETRAVEATLGRLHSIAASHRLNGEDRIYQLLELGCSRLGLETAVVCRVDRGVATLVAVSSDSPDLVPGEVVPLADTYCAETLVAQAPVAWHNLRPDPLRALGWDRRAFLGVALRVDGDVFGTLSFTSTQPRAPFTAFELQLARLVGAWVSQELRHARIVDRLRDEATTDPLTGLLNRRSWLAEAEKRLFDCHKSGATAALLILDLDHFKEVNDRFGHPAGDAVLRNVAQVLRDECRPGDRLARIGGEEFAVLLPGADEVGAAAVAERLRARLEAARFSVAGQTLGVTVSIGLMAYNPILPGVDAWYKLADRAVYLAKAEGRNCVRTGRLPQPALATPVPGGEGAGPLPVPRQQLRDL